MLMEDPTRSEVAARLSLAERSARYAGIRAQRLRRRPEGLKTSIKTSAQDLVTEADQAVERYLRASILRTFPADGLVGEEGGVTPGRSRFSWVIDPIDGTMSFAVGQPSWAVSIAVLLDGRPVAGVIHAPELHETYTAVQGAGARLNGLPIAMDPAATVSSTMTGFGANSRAEPAAAGVFVTRLYAAGGVLFRVASGALMLAYVASNRLGGYFDPTICAWDCMAGLVIIEEAGGRVHYGGTLEEPGPVWAGNETIFATLRAMSDAGPAVS